MSTEVAHTAAGAPPAAPPPTAPGLTRQLPVTIVAPVRPRQLAPLRRLLERMGDDPAANAVLPLGRLRTAHYARLVLLERTRDLDGKTIPAQLVFMSDIDAPLSVHLDDLVDLASGLDLVFGHCTDYPARRDATRKTRLRWLERHMVENQAFYVNTVGRTVSQVQREARLRDKIEEFLDGADWDGCYPLEIRAAIQEHVDADPELAWARAPADGPGALDRARDVAAVALPLAGVVAASPLLVPLLPVYALLLRRQELRDVVESDRPTAEHDRRLAELEDRGPENQFSAIGFVKPGLLRRMTIAVALRGLDVASRHVFNRRNLAGVKTTHFAHGGARQRPVRATLTLSVRSCSVTTERPSRGGRRSCREADRRASCGATQSPPRS